MQSQQVKIDALKRELNVLRQLNGQSVKMPFNTNTTSTSGSGYFYNTTIDFTKPKKKNWWKRNK